MHPILLRPTTHDHHIAILECEFLDWAAVGLVVDVTEHKVARGAEGEGGDTRVWTEEGFRVRVIGYRVLSVGIVVDEGEVVCLASDLFDFSSASGRGSVNFKPCERR